MPGTRKLGRPTDHRKAMLRAMVTFFLESGKIETTVTRAKEVASIAEKMITLGKTNSLHNKRQVMSFVTKEDVVKKLFDEIATVTAATPASTRPARAAATRPRWPFWSSSEDKHKRGQTTVCPLFLFGSFSGRLISGSEANRGRMVRDVLCFPALLVTP